MLGVRLPKPHMLPLNSGRCFANMLDANLPQAYACNTIDLVISISNLQSTRF